MHFTLETQKVRSYLLCVGLNSINGWPQHASTCTRILIGMVIYRSSVWYYLYKIIVIYYCVEDIFI